MKRSTSIAAAFAALALLAGPAAAQDYKEWSLQKFTPSIHSLGTFTVEAARVSHELTVNAFMMLNYGQGFLQGESGDDVVEGFGTGELVASIGLLDHLSFGFAIPIHFGATGTFLDGRDVADAGIGDIRLSLKAAAIKPWRIGPGIGLAIDIHVPSGSKGGYGREDGVIVMPKILIDAVTRHVHLMTNLFIMSRTSEFKPDTSNVALHPDLAIGAEAGIQVGAAIFLGSTDFRMLIEGRFASRLKRFFENQNNQLEFTWGLHWKHETGFAVGGGASFGVLSGYGDPDWRMFLSVGYQPGRYLPMPVVAQVGDRDSDGILDDADQCPDDPEDRDGFQDTDGCPDPDNDEDGVCDPWVVQKGLTAKYQDLCKGSDGCPNEPHRTEDGCPDPGVPDRDGDGILDDVDKCPDDAEDFDGFQDEDGCPDPDNDKDGICDPWVAAKGLEGKYAAVCKGTDKCPDEAEDKDGFQDDDGCPDPDNDNDGICDPWVAEQGLAEKYASVCKGKDMCPAEAEDFDGFQDDDGCPDPDNDKDGICDPWVAAKGLAEKYASVCKLADKCPDEAEDFDGCQDDDGCPETGKVCLTLEKIEISEKIFFRTGRATILDRSYPLLLEIATVLKENPHVKRVEVQGHTDRQGTDGYNMKLSDARARAVVEHLTLKLGVDPRRLVARGYGYHQPIGDNKTPAGRELNRRVEFVILEQDLPE